MGKKKHQFIDKKTAHKFTVGHRSQRDPLQADEESSQRVLIPVGDNTVDNATNSKDDPTTFGIYFDDDYDYMQHLRSRGEGVLVLADDLPDNGIEDGTDFQEKKSEKVAFGNLLLPSEALPSQVEGKVGMLAKGVLPKGPQPHWDPDIVAALDGDLHDDDDDDPDNFLEDDFMMLANGACDGSELNRENVLDNECRMQGSSNDWESISEGSNVDVDSDDLLSDEELDEYAEEETKTRFTNYSMTSSVIRRTEGLKLLDDRFERIMEEYDEEEIGCIDHEDVAGNFDANNELVVQVVDEFIKEQKTHELSEIKNDELNEVEDACDSDNEEETDEQLFAQFERKPKEKWDCESIISTYSNIYNHPKLIVENKKTKKYELDKKTGLPVGVLNDRKSSENPDGPNQPDENVKQEVVLNNIRNKCESAEEKRLRKQDVKEQRKNRRAEKKSNKIAFRNEYIKQEKSIMNTVAQKGVKL